VNRINSEERGSTLKSGFYDSAVRHNPVLVSGAVIAPIVVFVNTFENACTLVITFSIITVLTLLFSSFVSRKIVYTLRIILYALIGSLVYVPTAILLNAFMAESIEKMGVYFPLLITNSFIISRSETKFFAEERSRMIPDIFFSVIGYDIVVLTYGLVREILSTGGIGGKTIAMPIVLSGLSAPFGGFILLGLFSALFRGIILSVKRARSGLSDDDIERKA
jgi:electron transport complex protein RnfE